MTQAKFSSWNYRICWVGSITNRKLWRNRKDLKGKEKYLRNGNWRRRRKTSLKKRHSV